MINIIITSKISEKLESKHGIRRIDIENAFRCRESGYLEDTRINNKTEPPTLWFISTNDCDKLLKVVFVFDDGNVNIKTSYPPNEEEIRIYKKFAEPN